jgi:hypothetical protein
MVAVGAWPVAAQEADGPQHTVYLPLVVQQPTRPARLVAPADGAYQVQVQRGETQAAWQWLFYCYDRDADGECDAPGGTIGELTASARSLDVRVPISAGERLELFLYADTYGSLVTPQPIFYAWDWQAREAAPAPLIVRGESPQETRWDCDNDYDHRDLTLELSFVASVSREAAP